MTVTVTIQSRSRNLKSGTCTLSHWQAGIIWILANRAYDGENTEMIGERREIMTRPGIDVLRLGNEQSWASRASEKNEQFPLSCPQAAPQQLGGAIGRISIVAAAFKLEGKSPPSHSGCLVSGYCAFPP